MTTIVNGLKTAITTAWNGIKTTVSTVVNAIKTTVTNVWNGIKTAVTSVVNYSIFKVPFSDALLFSAYFQTRIIQKKELAIVNNFG